MFRDFFGLLVHTGTELAVGYIARQRENRNRVRSVGLQHRSDWNHTDRIPGDLSSARR